MNVSRRFSAMAATTRAGLIAIAALAFLPSCSETRVTSSNIDWVQNAGWLQAEHSFDYLLSCWADQWSEGVKALENAPATDLASDAEIAAAIAATRDNCGVQLMVRLDQIRVDLARQNVAPNQLDAAASAQLEDELRDMIFEYWSRL
jgi:hypothetical protein